MTSLTARPSFVAPSLLAAEAEFNGLRLFGLISVLFSVDDLSGTCSI